MNRKILWDWWNYNTFLIFYRQVDEIIDQKDKQIENLTKQYNDLVKKFKQEQDSHEEFQSMPLKLLLIKTNLISYRIRYKQA